MLSAEKIPVNDEYEQISKSLIVFIIYAEEYQINDDVNDENSWKIRMVLVALFASWFAQSTSD